jgi:hypothetical protein
MIEKVLSKNGILIRLTNERWAHIVEEHCELAGMRWKFWKQYPVHYGLAGGAGELLAVREVSPAMNLVVVYRELEDDGFIITAFVTSKMRSLNRRNQIWPK